MPRPQVVAQPYARATRPDAPQVGPGATERRAQAATARRRVPVRRPCDRLLVRGSDVVDVVLDWLPKRWVQVGFFVLFVVMVVTGWYEPVTWYVLDKAQGLAAQLTSTMQNMVTSLATPLQTPTVP